MSTSKQVFLFDSLGSTVPSSSRKAHIRRLVDILQLSIHRRDLLRAKRAWCILVRCPEFDWKIMWRTGLLLVSYADKPVGLNNESNDAKRLEYLRAMMLRSPENRVEILQELILRLIKGDRHREALEELELYLPSFPFQDTPVLHIYAGLLCLFLIQSSSGDLSTQRHTIPSTSVETISLNHASVRECKSHLRRALHMDPEHPVPSAFLMRIYGQLNALTTEGEEETESEGASNVDTSDNEKPINRMP